MPLKNIHYQLVSDDAGRLDSVLARLTKFPRSRVRGLLDRVDVNVNNQVCHDGGMTVAPGDQISFRYDPLCNYREKPAERKPSGFTLIYQDDSLAIVNKDASILTVPTERRETNTLIDRLSRFLANGRKPEPKLWVVHRLDRETSGLLVFARSQAIATHLIKQFAQRKPEREYYAVVSGQLPQDQGIIRSYLKTDSSLNQKSSATGELAVTHYQVIFRAKHGTHVSVRLETGRRNQIRVHFAEMGHPILGDERYESQLARHREWPHRRLALHARVLGFEHPISKIPLSFTVDLPQEIKRLAAKSPSSTIIPANELGKNRS